MTNLHLPGPFGHLDVRVDSRPPRVSAVALAALLRRKEGRR
jgi:hypothetical protein